MYPDLLKVPGLNFTIHSYGLMLLIAFFVAVWAAKKRAPRFGLSPTHIYDGAFWALILGVLGARVFYIAQEWDHYSKNLRELFSWQFAGLTSFGAIVFGLLGLYVWSRSAKRSFVRVMDVMSVPFLIAHAIGRVGCLLNGCCYGGQCNLPWGIHVAGHGGLFHPAQIYDSLMNLGAVGLLLLVEKKGVPYGRSFSLALILHGVARFIYEFWRAGTEQQVKNGLATSTYMGHLPITDAQAAALFFIIAGVVLFFYLPRRNERRMTLSTSAAEAG